MALDLLVHGGTLVTEAGLVLADIGVRDGRIVSLTDPLHPPAATEQLDARGRHVFPGVVDAHVHLNDPGRTHWEGFASGTAAAAVGGTTTVMDMPLNSSPPVIDRAALDLKQRVAQGQARVDYALWGGLVTDNVASLGALVDGGVVGCKAFMCDSGIDEYARATDGVLLAGLRELTSRGAILALHAENTELCDHAGADLRARGRRDWRAWAESRPPLVELEAVRRGLLLASQVPSARLHFVHLSTSAALREVATARRAGLDVTAETCPHYLSLTVDDLERAGSAAKCAPPLREAAEIEALWQCVMDGAVSFIASDHSPASPEEKEKGGGDAWLAWGGISGIQTLLAAVLTEGVHRRGLPLPSAARLLSTAPSRRFGLYPRKGSLNIGADADLTIVDLDREWTLRPDSLRTRHPLSPFIGRSFKGWVEATLVRGVVVARDGEAIGPSDHGLLLRPIT
ncbi:MAG: allantoinase AllB [Chloroflexota bacterium]